MRKATCSLVLLLAGVRPLRREKDPSLMAECQGMATCEHREKPQTELRRDVARAADLGVRGFPQLAIYPMISVSGYLRPSEGLRLTRINVSLPVAGVSEFWFLLLHPKEGLQRSKTGTHWTVLNS